MDAPLAVVWPARPGVEFVIKNWARNDAQLRFVDLRSLDPETPSQYSVPIDELELVDKTVPDVLGAIRTLRDFNFVELGVLRRDSTDFAYMAIEAAEPSGNVYDGLPAVIRKRDWRSVAMQGTALDKIPEERRDEKMCTLALERDVFQYPAVPARFRTDERDAEYLKAKRDKRAREEAAEAAEVAAKADAEEARKRRVKKQKAASEARVE